MKEISQFTKGYLDCALWSSTGDDGRPLDATHSIKDIDPKSLEKEIIEVEAFRVIYADKLEAAKLSDSRLGHNLWLSRNGHGSGFFDEYFDGSAANFACDQLQEICRDLGSKDLYGGDEKALYFS